MTGSRLVMYLSFWDNSLSDNTGVWRVVVWDWKTGDLVRTLRSQSGFSHVNFQVSDHSSTDKSRLIDRDCQVAFLDEFRIMVLNYKPSTHGTLTVFNTLVPQDPLRYLRQFGLPSKYLGRNAHVYLDRDRSLGSVNRDGCLLVDPAQAILAVGISPGSRGNKETLLILRTQSLIECVCSMRADVQIPWDEWLSGAVAMESPIFRKDSVITIHGTRMLVGDSRHHERYRIHVFDFSRLGSAALQISDENDGRTEKKVIFKDGRSCEFEVGDEEYVQGLESLGDSIMVNIVSVLFHSSEECVPG